MDTFAADDPAGDLRVSDADRDRALTELSGHFQAGRLDAEEFDERSERILRSRTGRELAAVFVDMPRPQAPAPVAEPAPGAGFGIPPVLIAAATIGLVFAIVGTVTTHNGGPGGFGFLVLAFFILRRRLGLAGRQRRGR